MKGKEILLVMVACNGLNGVFMLILGYKLVSILCLGAMLFAMYGLFNTNKDQE